MSVDRSNEETNGIEANRDSSSPSRELTERDQSASPEPGSTENLYDDLGKEQRENSKSPQQLTSLDHDSE